MNKMFSQIWDQLRAKKAQFPEFLEEVTLQQIRGIKHLSVGFEFPVTVIAGPNGSGKSTVLFACACAYQVPGAGIRDFVPTTLFPNLKASGHEDLCDKEIPSSFEYFFIHQGRRFGMKWSRGKSWNKSFMGLKGGKQPVRPLYMRTLANLTSPNEIRSFLQIASTNYEATEITSDLIAFAQRIVPNRYRKVREIQKNDKNLLFVDRDDVDSQYSEFHMSAGERAILRISKDISSLRNALILIDEIEAGLHPYTQQQLMLELQRLALRNDLQIIITSHSPVILDCVPVEARVFLERTADNVQILPAYRDIIQKAFYGQSIEKLSILCEDDVAEAFLYGVMDVLNPKLRLIHDDVVIGRDTGKEMFSQHIEAIGKFKLLDNFIFVLDGDARSLENNLKLVSSKFGREIQPLFLPGDVPERWAWKILDDYSKEYATELGMSESDLKQQLLRSNQTFDNAADKPANIMKNKFHTFCETLRRSETELMRTIAKKEAERESADIKVFMDELEMQLRNWQARSH
jgi:predicted ATPase